MIARKLIREYTPQSLQAFGITLVPVTNEQDESSHLQQLQQQKQQKQLHANHDTKLQPRRPKKKKQNKQQQQHNSKNDDKHKKPTLSKQKKSTHDVDSQQENGDTEHAEAKSAVANDDTVDSNNNNNNNSNSSNNNDIIHEDENEVIDMMAKTAAARAQFNKMTMPSNVTADSMLGDLYRYSSSIWDTIHAFAFAYPDSPTREEQERARQFYEAIAFLLPCSVCRGHYRQMISRPEYRIRTESRRALAEWSVRIHNAVNMRTGAPQWTYEQASRKWVGVPY